MGDLWAKRFENFPGENLWEFSGKCKGMSGNFLGKTDQKEMSRRLRGELSGRLCGGMFSGKCTAVNFFFGGGICQLKISKRMRRNFLGEISQGNVWGLSGKALSGCNVA